MTVSSTLSQIFVTPEWLATQDKTIQELHNEVSDDAKLLALSRTCTALSDAYIKYPQTHADEAWQNNQDAFISRTKWTFPFDHARVCKDINGFFINASEMVLEGQKYIASQAPLSSTFVDFWKMIIHTKATTIVALNMPQDDKDDAEPRPIEYWKQSCLQVPPVFENWKAFDAEVAKIQTLISFDNWTIRFIKREVVATEEGTEYAIVKREFTASNSQTGQERQIKQFHFQHWPDFKGAPTDRLFATLLELVEAAHEAADIPLLVHCAAGKGRAGQFIAAHSMRRQIRQALAQGQAPHEVKVNLPRTIYTMREHRKDMVTEKGIPSICKALKHLI